jgi:choline dehydrogenase-like flavoprotein
MSRAKIVEDATDEVKRRLGTLPEAEEVGKDVLILERGGKVTVTETVKHELGVTRFVTMPLRVPLSDASITQLSGARIPTVGEAIQRQSEIRTEQMARARELVVPAVHFRHDELACAMFMARDGNGHMSGQHTWCRGDACRSWQAGVCVQGCMSTVSVLIRVVEPKDRAEYEKLIREPGAIDGPDTDLRVRAKVGELVEAAKAAGDV